MGKSGTLGAAITPPFLGRLREGAGRLRGGLGTDTSAPDLAAGCPCAVCSGPKGMRRSNGCGSVRARTIRARLGRPALRLRLWRTAPLLGRGRCLAYRALRRPSLRGAPAPRLPRCAGGCGPSAARPPARLAPGVAAALPVCGRPCVGWAGLAWLRPCGPRVASVRVAGSPRARFSPCSSPRGARGGRARQGRAFHGSAAALGPRGRGCPLRRGCVAPGSAVQSNGGSMKGGGENGTSRAGACGHVCR